MQGKSSTLGLRQAAGFVAPGQPPAIRMPASHARQHLLIPFAVEFKIRCVRFLTESESLPNQFTNRQGVVMRNPMRFLPVFAAIGAALAVAQSRLPTTPVHEVTEAFWHQRDGPIPMARKYIRSPGCFLDEGAERLYPRCLGRYSGAGSTAGPHQGAG